eukprot:gene1440-2786_t
MPNATPSTEFHAGQETVDPPVVAGSGRRRASSGILLGCDVLDAPFTSSGTSHAIPSQEERSTPYNASWLEGYSHFRLMPGDFKNGRQARLPAVAHVRATWLGNMGGACPRAGGVACGRPHVIGQHVPPGLAPTFLYPHSAGPEPAHLVTLMQLRPTIPYHFDGLATVLKVKLSGAGSGGQAPATLEYMNAPYHSAAEDHWDICTHESTGTSHTGGPEPCLRNPAVNLLPLADGQMWLCIDTYLWGRMDRDTLATVPTGDGGDVEVHGVWQAFWSTLLAKYICRASPSPRTTGL